MKHFYFLLLILATYVIPAQTNAELWQKTSVYQIYPRSYYDSNGDGIGDLNGIIQKLDYIQRLGYETIWISPYTQSPQKDFGYDISNYREIAAEYGVMADFDSLVAAVHGRGMKLLFDLVLNHPSIEHDWFKAAASAETNEKTDLVYLAERTWEKRYATA